MKEKSEVTVVFSRLFLIIVDEKYRQTMKLAFFNANLVFQILNYIPPDNFCYYISISENLIILICIYIDLSLT